MFDKYPTIQLITVGPVINLYGRPTAEQLARLAVQTFAIEATSMKHVLSHFGKTIKKALGRLCSVECRERVQAQSAHVCTVMARAGLSGRYRCWVLLWVCSSPGMFYSAVVNLNVLPTRVSLRNVS